MNDDLAAGVAAAAIASLASCIPPNAVDDREMAAPHPPPAGRVERRPAVAPRVFVCGSNGRRRQRDVEFSRELSSARPAIFAFIRLATGIRRPFRRSRKHAPAHLRGINGLRLI
jgi:hypothetical protein